MQSSLISKQINERNEKSSVSILTRVFIEIEYVSTVVRCTLHYTHRHIPHSV